MFPERWIMGSRLSKLLFLLCLIAGVLLAGSDSGGDKPVKLRFTPLRDTDCVLTQSDVRESAFFPVSISDGKVLPGNSFSFRSGGALTLLIGGKEFKVSLQNGKSFISIDGRDRQMKNSAAGCKTEMLPLENRQRYMLAFPYADLRGTSARIWYRSGSAMTGRAGKGIVSLYDDNCDGKFVIGHDSVQNNSAAVFAPLSKIIVTQNEVFQIDSLSEDGSEMILSPYTGSTARMTYRFASVGRGVEMHIAFKGSGTGCTGAVKVDNRPLTVPEDEYALLYGLLYMNGSKKAVAAITPGESKPAEVKADEENVVTLGGPLSLFFTPEVSSGKLTISPGSIKIYGTAGELYTGFDLQGAPRVSVIVDGKEKPLGSFGFG